MNKPTTRNKTVATYGDMGTSFQDGEFGIHITRRAAFWFHISVLIKHLFAKFVPYRELTQSLQTHNIRGIGATILVYAV